MPIHVEAYVDLAIATLRARLPGVIAGINAAASDFTIDAPADDAYDFGGGNVVVFPAVEVAVADALFRDFSLGMVWGEGELPLIVKLAATGSSPERLYRTLLRYGRALYAVLCANDAIAGAWIDPRGPVRFSYRFNPESDEVQDQIGAVLAVFPFRVAETTA